MTGAFQKSEDIPSDYRKNSPRFQKENFESNLNIVEKLQELAREKNCTPSQLALAWVLAQGKYIVPIAGTKRRKYLEENISASEIQLSMEDLERIDQLIPRGSAKGLRYPEQSMKALNR